MDAISKITNGGWGALAVYIFSYSILEYWDLASQRSIMVFAAVPPLLIMFTVVRFNHQLNEFWAGGNLKQSTAEIQQITGEKDSYHSASEEVQNAIDEFDEKAFGHHVGILSGIVLAVATIVIGYLQFGPLGVLLGGIAGFALIWGVSIRSYHELNRLARKLSTPYKEKYENQ